MPRYVVLEEVDEKPDKREDCEEKPPGFFESLAEIAHDFVEGILHAGDSPNHE